MRVIIACGGRGDDPKWGNHCGVPKHLAPVGGRPLLQRTVEQVAAHTGDVIVTAPPDPRYELDGAELVHPEMLASNEYTGTRPWWSTTGRTVLLLGDVYWTRYGLATVLGYGERGMRWFGRRGASRHTASRWGEIFAVSWWPEHHDLLDEHLEAVDASPVTRPPGWKLYRSLHGLPLDRHRLSGDWTQIDDATDDFDTPATYAAHPAIRQRR